MIKGVLFDFDGTIVNSEVLRFRGLKVVFEEAGITLTQKAWDEKYRRLDSLFIIREVLGCHPHVSADADELLERSHRIADGIVRTEGIGVIDGFFEFHAELEARGVKTIICSGGRKSHIELDMKAANLPDIPFVSVEEYTLRKPHPDVYLIGCERIGLNPWECLVIDDSFTGIQAAKAAKAKRTIAINCEHEAGIDSLKPDYVVKTYRELDVNEVLK